MALIKMVKPDGQTMIIDENSPLKASLTSQGWSVQGSNTNNNNNNQFQGIASNWNTGSNNNGATDSTINSLYQKYFGRNASSAELTEWKKPTNSLTSLENKLKQDYKAASGIDYDGSPIKPGNNKSDNQLNVGTETNNVDAINSLYQQYFGRNATTAEVANWSKESSQALDTFLQDEYKKANNGQAYTDSPIMPGDTTPTEVSAEDRAWINAAYQKYFDRPATSKELQNWAKETPNALDQFLAKEQKDYGYVSSAMGAERKKRYDDAIAVIDASNLPDDIKQIWRTTVGMYPDATDFNTDEIMNTFNQIKSSTIDPYYKELADVAINDIKTTIGEMSGSRERELEAEQAAAKNAVTNAQSNLEKTGMTFSGKGVEQLGTGSAYAGAPAPELAPIANPNQKSGGLMQGISGDLGMNTGVVLSDTPPSGTGQMYTQVMPPAGMKYMYQPDGTRVTVPINGPSGDYSQGGSLGTVDPNQQSPGKYGGQTPNLQKPDYSYMGGSLGTVDPNQQSQVSTPFAGIDSNLMQGSVGQQNRLISTSTAARYKSDQQELGRQAENFLGTSGASNISGLNYTPAGVNLTGSNALAKETKTASTLQQLIDQWRTKQENALN